MDIRAIRERAFLNRAGLPAYSVLLLALILSAIAWYFAQRTVVAHERNHFNRAVTQTIIALNLRMEAYTTTLHGVAAIFAASENVTRREFRTFVETVDIERRHPSIHGVGLIRRVRAAERAGYLAAMRAEHGANPCGYPDVSVFPKEIRTEYYLIELVEPILVNRELFGRDVLTEPACLEAMERARDSGEPAVTAPVRVVRGDQERLALFMLMPLYVRGQALETVAGRRAAIEGFVFAQLLAEELFGGIFGKLENPRIDLEVFDGEIDTGRLLFDNDRVLHALHSAGNPHFTQTVDFEAGGRRWRLHFTSLKVFHDRWLATLPLAILLTGSALGVVLFRVNIAQSRHAHERQRHTTVLEYQATHDSLTRLVNRDYLYARLQVTFEQNDPRPRTSALLLIDLDRFKEINDTLGHQSGDRLLTDLGARLRPLLRPDDVLARLGGDVWALLLLGLGAGPAPGPTAERILDEIRRPFELDGISVQIDASIGIALYPEHGRDAVTLMRCADVAMYIAKRNNAGHALYDSTLDPHSPRRLTLLSEIARAVDGGELLLYYQPKVDMQHRRITGVEALARWDHPRSGLILPGEFIPQVETSPLVRNFTLWVIEAALTQCLRWHESAIPVQVAVNISARNLADSELPDRVAALIERHRASAGCLEMEITESALIADPERALAVLTRLHGLGVRLAIDDFGTGYSSLAFLKKLPISTLKIDSSFISGITEDDNDAVIVHSTIALAHNLGLTVVAEGVETTEQRDLLEIIGCDQAQGYLFCRPQPASKIDAFLRRGLPVH